MDLNLVSVQTGSVVPVWSSGPTVMPRVKTSKPPQEFLVGRRQNCGDSEHYPHRLPSLWGLQVSDCAEQLPNAV